MQYGGGVNEKCVVTSHGAVRPSIVQPRRVWEEPGHDTTLHWLRVGWWENDRYISKNSSSHFLTQVMCGEQARIIIAVWFLHNYNELY